MKVPENYLYRELGSHEFFTLIRHLMGENTSEEKLLEIRKLIVKLRQGAYAQGYNAGHTAGKKLEHDKLRRELKKIIEL